MSNLNKVMLMGNLTRDPELRYTPKGTAVGDIGIAINRKSTDANGQTREETTFVDVTLWGRTAELAQQYLGKGRGVFVEGRLQLDSWEDRASGQKRSKLKVVADSIQFLPGGNRDGGPQRDDQSRSQGQGHQPNRQAPDDDFDEDEIPF